MQHALRSSTSRGCASPLSHLLSSHSFIHRLPSTLELMAAASSTKMQWIRTSIQALYPQSADALSQRTPRRTPYQYRHIVLTDLATLLLSVTVTTMTLSCLIHPRAKVHRDYIANLRASGNHHRQSGR